MQVNTRPDTMSTIASYFGIDAKKLQRHYKYQISGFKEWSQLGHAGDYLLYPENITTSAGI